MSTQANPLGLSRNVYQANQVGGGPGGVRQGQYTQQQRMILEAFRAQQYVQDTMDVQAEPVYDTVTVNGTGAAGGAQTIAENTTTALFFQNTANKTLNLTNMTQPNQLMNPEALAIYCYRYYLDPRNSIVDTEAVLAGFAFVFTMGRKPYQTLPLWMIPQGGGLNFLGTASGTSILSNGWPSKDAIRPIAITLVLEQGVQFFAGMYGPSYTITGTGNFISAVILDGLHARGIQ